VRTILNKIHYFPDCTRYKPEELDVKSIVCTFDTKKGPNIGCTLYPEGTIL